MKRGRKPKYSPEIVQKITDALRIGATNRLACEYAGISHETFYRWQAEKPEFCEAIKQAAAAGAMNWLTVIERAANEGVWAAAAWKLERRHPDGYRRVQDTFLSGTGGGPIQIAVYDYGAAAAELGRSGAAQLDEPQDYRDDDDDEAE